MVEVLSVENVRKDFPILKRKIRGRNIVYFDNAATTQKPIQVIEKLKEFYEWYNANIHRGIHELSEEATEMYEKSKRIVGEFIGARWFEIIYTKNATEALNLVSMMLEDSLKKEDKILTTVMEHHSNLLPWMRVAKRKGAKLEFINIREDGTLELEDIENMMSRKVKIVALTHASNVLGTINDVKEIAKIAHDYEALIVVDGAQSVPHMRVNVRDLDVDFLAFSAHKMLGPTGLGVLYGKANILENLEPPIVGGGAIKDVTLKDVVWDDLPWKFEAGTPNFAGAIAFTEAIRYLKKLGMENVERHGKFLTKYVIEKLLPLVDKIVGPLDVRRRVPLVSFWIKNIHPHDIATLLNEHNIAVRSGMHCAHPLHKMLKLDSGTTRVSFYIYNTKDEIDYFIEVMSKIIEIFEKA